MICQTVPCFSLSVSGLYQIYGYGSYMNLIKYIEDKERYRCECGKCYDGRSKCFILCHICPSVHLIICFYLSRLFQITCYPDLSYYDPPIHCCHLNPYLDIFLLMLGPFLLCYLFSLYPVHSYSFIIFIW